MRPGLPRSSVAALSALLFTPAAHAEPRAASVRLDWIRGPGAEGCQSRAELAATVSRRLGRPVFAENASEAIEAFVKREGDQWVAHVSMRDASGSLVGSRDLRNDAPDCTGLDAAVALAIALVIDPSAALRSSTPALAPWAAPGGAPTPPPPAPPPPPLPSAVMPPRSHDASPESSTMPACPVERPCPKAERETAPTQPASFGARALVSGGLLPGASAGGSLFASVRLTRWLDITGGAFFLPQSRTADGDFGFSLTAAYAGVCAVPWRGRLTLSLCGEVSAGAIDAVVYALAPTHPGDRGWAALSGEAAVRGRIVGPVALEVGASAVVPLVRQPFEVEGEAGHVFQESPVAAIGFVGAVVTVP